MAIDFEHLPKDAIAGLCCSWGVRRLAIFGSAIREDFGPNSDIDLLVEFEAGDTPGLGFFRLQHELAELFGRRVDLHTPASLGKSFRDEVSAAARDVYVAA